ncbi:TetR/AcrR family transcriptional regulator [Deinococcus irradiatisoli]|uniref:TetR/AcrR family transcriptional regulator n=1 Tax=Deinococcus irradiatisoli TaxID=2202254 RepID=A0A2Z3JJ61_9DEIO|nr:TetR/AcrR family transcriptional regulator [Deinococcus irradiatisoli]AWN23390.1 TetR/AcrR family transcriptional regulator [Deinococcus irradiatisoli]
MARPRTISDEQIVEAAREVFLEQGFSATTAEIARRAGVSEGTLFNRFASKEELFAETLGLNERGHCQTDFSALVGSGDVRLNLEQLAWRFLDAARRILPQLMVIWSRGQAPMVKPAGWRDPLSEEIEALSRYLQAEVTLGRLRPIDCQVAAAALLGALMSQVHRELQAGPGIEGARFVRSLLDMWWPGMQPFEPPGAASSQSGSTPADPSPEMK